MRVIGQIELGVMRVDPLPLSIHNGESQEFLANAVIENQVDLLGGAMDDGLLVGIGLDQNGMGQRQVGHQG